MKNSLKTFCHAIGYHTNGKHCVFRFGVVACLFTFMLVSLNTSAQKLNRTRVKYKVLTWTQDRENAGTDDAVFVSWTGPYGKTKRVELNSPGDDNNRGNWSTFWIPAITEGVGDTGPAIQVDVEMNGDDDWFFQRIVVERWVDEQFKQRSNFNYLGELGDDAGKHKSTFWEDNWETSRLTNKDIEETIYEQVWVIDNRQRTTPLTRSVKDNYSFSEEVLKQRMREKSNSYEVSVKTESKFFGAKVKTSMKGSGSSKSQNTNSQNKAKIQGREISADFNVAPGTLEIRTIIVKVSGKEQTRNFSGNNFSRWYFDPTTIFVAYDGSEVIHKDQTPSASQQQKINKAKNVY